MGEQRGGGGIADAHFAETDHIAAGRGHPEHDAGALLDGLGALGDGHRRLFDVIGRAGSHLDVDQPGALIAEIVRHAGIDYRQPEAVLAGEDVDRRTTGQEILDHLPGHFLRKGRHTGLGRAVITGKDQHLRVVQGGGQGLLDQADLQRRLFQQAERAERLGLAVDLVVQGGGDATVGGHDFKRMHPILQKAKKASRPRFPHATAKPCPQASHLIFRQVFWLPDRPGPCVFPEGLSPLVVTWCNGSPRLQRRARPGIEPRSHRVP